MSIQPPLPKREAIVLRGDLPAISFDPIMLPVELSAHGLMADVFDLALVRLVRELIDSSDEDLTLVWSDGQSTVMGLCPACDKPFPVALGRMGTLFDVVECKGH